MGKGGGGWGVDKMDIISGDTCSSDLMTKPGRGGEDNEGQREAGEYQMSIERGRKVRLRYYLPVWCVVTTQCAGIVGTCVCAHTCFCVHVCVWLHVCVEGQQCCIDI